MNFGTMKKDAAARLRAAGLDSPSQDAALLIMHAANLDRSDLIIRGDDSVPAPIQRAVDGFCARRLAGEPVDHILGYRDFYGRRFQVTKDVLSPRPETEGVVDQALTVIKQISRPNVLDLGTGSGAIITSILMENTKAIGTATDISNLALGTARENATIHNISSRVTFIKSNWFEYISGRFDVVVSNPPYISDAAMDNLSLEVKNFDPNLALRGGEDGLSPYRHILRGAKDHLRPGGYLIMEIGYDQGAALLQMMREAKLSDVALLQDLSGLDRIIMGKN